MRKILFVVDAIPPLEYSGIPNITWNQACELSKTNKVGIIINSPDIKDKFKKSKVKDISIYTIPRVFPDWMSLSYHYKNFSNKDALMNVLNIFQPDILQINGYFNLDVRDFRFFCGLPTKIIREVCYFDDVCMKGNLLDGNLKPCSGPSVEKCSTCYFDSYQSSSKGFFKSQIKYKTVPWLLKKQTNLVNQIYEDIFAGIVFPSQSFKDFFGKYVELRDKSKVIPHGIDLTRNKRSRLINCNNIIFGFIASLQYRKGVGIILEMLKKLIEQNIKGFKLLIWGTSCEEKYLREILELEKNYPELISYEGDYTPEDIPKIAASVDIGLVTSYTETYCLVLREWLSQGVPCITTNYFGSEIITDGKNGFIIPTGDAEALSYKIQKILDEPAIIKNLTRAAADTFIPTVADECKELEKFYDKLISE